MIKKFFVKLAAFSLLIFLAQVLCTRTAELPDKLKLLRFFAKKQVDIIYFGDSSTTWADKLDPSNKSMQYLLQYSLPAAKVGRIAYPSYQMDIYYAYAANMARQGYHPKFVIIPINLRSFSPEWDRQPLWQFADLKFLAKYEDTIWVKFYQPLRVFKLFDAPISRYEYEQTPVYNGERCIGRVRDFDNPSYAQVDEEKIKKKLTFRYLYKLTAQNRKIQSMKKLAALLQAEGIGVIFYITPVDVQTGVQYLGQDFLMRIKEHTRFINSQLAEKSLEALDLSSSLPTEFFSWREGDTERYSNEHLKLPGRMFVVKSLLEKTALKNTHF
jgi:hypothetical protein